MFSGIALLALVSTALATPCDRALCAVTFAENDDPYLHHHLRMNRSQRDLTTLYANGTLYLDVDADRVGTVQVRLRDGVNGEFSTWSSVSRRANGTYGLKRHGDFAWTSQRQVEITASKDGTIVDRYVIDLIRSEHKCR